MTTSETEAPEAPPEELVTLTIDDVSVSVPKGTLLIRAAELMGTQIPRFCDHPLLEPVGACRQCLVEITDAGNGRGFPKPQASCTITVAEGMVVRTQLSSPVADKAQQGIMEFLLSNHPLDCPICDKGGECPLQNQAMANGRGESRFEETKRTFPKPIPISSQILLDRERCVLCARCTRFSDQIAGDPFIDMQDRGAFQQVGIYEDEPFSSYFSGNTIQICPVGALTSVDYRFRSRPFDLISSPSTCEHCASGCSLRTDHRRGTVTRRLAGDEPEVNEEWSCDKGRFAFRYAMAGDRLTQPLVRNADTGELEPASWTEAFRVAAAGLRAAVDGQGLAVLTGGRVTREDAYAYAKFARVAGRTNDIDFRARAHSAEEEAFLGAAVAGTGLGVTYRDLERARTVLLVGLEPEEESPIVFLRLRKAYRKNGTRVFAVAPYTTNGLTKTSGTLLRAAPGTEAEVLDALALGDPGSGLDEQGLAAARGLTEDGAFVLVGERLADVPGGLSAAISLAQRTGARLAWVPRRAGERGALDAGAVPSLLPGGRPVADAAARVDVGAIWGAEVPAGRGRDTAAIVEAAATGDLDALVVGGVEIADLPDPDRARRAVDRAGFVVSLEQRPSEVTERADVVFPVAAVAEKAGTFVDWEGRPRPFEKALQGSDQNPDVYVLAGIADAMGVRLGFADVAGARAELEDLGPWDGARVAAPVVPATLPPLPESGKAVLASWRPLLGAGRLQVDEAHLAGTARPAYARVSPATAATIGASGGEPIEVSAAGSSVRLPLEITDLPDGVVWVPGGLLPGAATGVLVSVARAETTVETTAGMAGGVA